jgi:hypothetical protein
MKKLAPCAIPIPEQRAQLKADQLTRAYAYCAAHGRIQADPYYLNCLARFAHFIYGMWIAREAEGSLTLVSISKRFLCIADGLYFPPLVLKENTRS